MAKRAAESEDDREEDENATPPAKARKTSQASTSKQGRNSSDASGKSQTTQVAGKVERFGSGPSHHLRHNGAGQIKRVKVTNFMCHSNMVVDFNEHVNFISGPNGSGKSAILQALQYCLGVRATATGRAQTNAAYLKKGEDVCTAEVTLWNTGPDEDTYKPHLYGPTITIQKTLSSKGATSTKVLDHRGNKTGLSKADDVRQLLAKLSVNAANPSIVLTQDHARGLLTGKNVNRHLYELMEESLDYNSTFTYLNTAREDIAVQREEVGKHRDARKETEKKLQEITERLEDAEEAAFCGKVAEDLEDQKAWAVVRHLRAKVAEVDAGLLEGPERTRQLQQGIESLEEELRGLEERSAELGAVEKELATKAAAHNAAREKLRAQKKEAIKYKNAITVKQRQKEQELAEAKQDQKEAEQQIAAVKARGDDKASIDKQMADWQEAHKHASEMVQTSQQALNQQRKQSDDLEAQLQAAKESFADARRECEAAKKKVQQATGELHNLQRSNGPYQDAMTFDDQAGILLEAISKNTQRFRKPVLGPVGACLTLEASAKGYSATVCAALRHLLSAWIVDSREDQQALMALAKRAGCRHEPKVFIMRYDLPPHRDRMHRNQLPVESITTIMNVLRIKPVVQCGHVVMNVLIDHGAIERIGLAEDERAGQELLSNGPIWQNLLKVLCNAPSGPVEMQRKGNNNNVWPWTYAAPEPLLDADKSQIIAARQRNVEKEADSLQVAQDFEIEQQSALRAAQEAQRTAADEMKSLQHQVKTAKQQEQNVMSERPEVRVSADDELAEAFELQHNAQQVISRLTPEMNDLVEQFEQAKQAMDEVNQLVHAQQHERKRDEQQLEGQLAFMTANDTAKQKLQMKKDTVLKKLEKHEGMGQDMQEQRDILADVLAQCLEDAQSTGTEDEADQERPALRANLEKLAGDWIRKKYGSADSIIDDRDNLQAMVKIIQKRGQRLAEKAKGSVEELRMEKETLDAKDAGNRKQTGRFEKLVASQQESWQARKLKFYEIRKAVDSSMNQKFKDMLRTGRNWRGTVTVDHDERQVVLSVTPHKGASTEGATAVKDMKSLSGGERSFTSVSFVLSLGQEVSTPFFAMDEFDVFMDAVNRKVALTSILKFAWELKGTQFILLSPLDMSVVEQSRADVNSDFRRKANGCKFEEMPKGFIKSVAMQPPRVGARAHF